MIYPPAREQFELDPRVRMRHWRLYAFFRNHLDFLEARSFSLDALQHLSGMSRTQVTLARSELIRWGYLIVHEHDKGQPLPLTLAWSVRAAA